MPSMPKRLGVLELEYTDELTRVTVRGEPDEAVALTFAVADERADAGFAVVVVECTISAAGTATATVTSATETDCA